MSYNTKRKRAGCIITDQSWTKVLLVKGYSKWGLPKGHVEPGETLEETAEREVYEETGLRIMVGEHKTTICGVVYYYHVATERVCVPALPTEVVQTRWVAMKELRTWDPNLLNASLHVLVESSEYRYLSEPYRAIAYLYPPEPPDEINSCYRKYPDTPSPGSTSPGSTSPGSTSPGSESGQSVPEAVPKVPEAVPKVPEAVPKVPEAVPKVPDTVPKVPEAVPVSGSVPASIPVPVSAPPPPPVRGVPVTMPEPYANIPVYTYYMPSIPIYHNSVYYIPAVYNQTTYYTPYHAPPYHAPPRFHDPTGYHPNPVQQQWGYA